MAKRKKSQFPRLDCVSDGMHNRPEELVSSNLLSVELAAAEGSVELLEVGSNASVDESAEGASEESSVKTGALSKLGSSGLRDETVSSEVESRVALPVVPTMNSRLDRSGPCHHHSSAN